MGGFHLSCFIHNTKKHMLSRMVMIGQPRGAKHAQQARGTFSPIQRRIIVSENQRSITVSENQRSTVVPRSVSCVVYARSRRPPARVTRAGVVCPSNTTTGASVGQATQVRVSKTPSSHNEQHTNSEKHHRTANRSACRARSTTNAACAHHARWYGLPQKHHLGCECRASHTATRAKHAQQVHQTTDRFREPSYY